MSQGRISLKLEIIGKVGLKSEWSQKWTVFSNSIKCKLKLPLLPDFRSYPHRILEYQLYMAVHFLVSKVNRRRKE